MHKKTKRLALCGLLGALAIVLSLLEGLLPPIPGLPPGARLGLSNVVTMFAAGAFGLPLSLSVALLKGGFALLTRGLTAGLMSLSGGFLSALVMYVVYKKTRCTLLLTGVCGALAHNAAQLAVALALTGPAAVAFLPPMLLLSVLTGAASGLVLRLLLPALQRAAKHLFFL